MTLLPRFHRRQQAVEDAQKIAEILIETGEPAALEAVPATAPGDTRKLRGIPVIGGVGGTMPGTDPVAALLRKEGR